MSKKNVVIFTKCLLLASILFVLTACLKDKDRYNAERLGWQLEDMATQIEVKKTNFENMKESENSDIVKYVEAENWKKYFEKASTKLATLNEEYNRFVSPILDKGDETKAQEMNEAVSKIRKDLREVKSLINTPFEKLALVKKTKSNFEQMGLRVQDLLARMDDTQAIFAKWLGESEKLDKESSKYLKGEIDKAKRLYNLSKSEYKPVQEEIEKAKQGLASPNFLLIAKNFKSIEQSYDKYMSIFNSIQEEMKTADVVVTKLVSDLKTVGVVQVVRVGWDSGSDSNTEHEYIYPPREVSDKVYEYFKALDPEKEIADYSKKLFSSEYVIDPKIEKFAWAELRIDPHESWPITTDDSESLKKHGIDISTGPFSGIELRYQVQSLMEEKGLVWPSRGGSHNDSGFWLYDVYRQPYALIKIYHDGNEFESEWVAYDEEEAEEYAPFLGMAIYSKPAGVLSWSAYEEAIPPGMNLVGDKRYGEWRKDGNSDKSFWHFYGQYVFYNNLLGFPISSSDHKEWRNKYRGNGAYFGSTANNSQRWGTKGAVVRTNGIFQNTGYAQRGGLKTPVASARNANMRGGGPGARGK